MENNLDRLDLMIAYSCNISCRGCISLSDFKRDGVAPYNDIVEWVNHWSTLVTPKVLTIFGGEPCIHPKLIEICDLVRTAWPSTTIRLITNGYLLGNFDPNEWFRFAPFEMQVSVHRLDQEKIINQQIKKILLHRKGWTIEENPHRPAHEQLSWSADGVKIYKSIFKDFVVPFRLEDNRIKPWTSSPEEAHKICGAPNTPILYKGKLYKCPAVANAIDLSGENWFNYQPCDGADTLEQFLSGVGIPEPVCAQCPDRQQAVVIDHFDINNVTVKHTISN
jgi:hypothetical protein